jgi:hypothetical protein
VTRRPVTRLGRKLDLVSLIFIVVGATLFVLAFLGMAELRDLRPADFVPGTVEAYASINRYYRLQTLFRLGIGIAVAGVLIGLSAAWHNRKFGTTDAAIRSE